MSANSAVTVLRSPSGTSLGSAATRTLDDSGPSASALGEAWASSEAPQLPQNLNEGLFSAPHCGHLAESADPHPPQNLFPAGFSVAHFEQRISASSCAILTAPRMQGSVAPILSLAPVEAVRRVFYFFR
jgi:hypothetical protein